ncbi:transcriptional regulator [Escherichia coli]|nr:transcriptional regulator [Escherichia coli]
MKPRNINNSLPLQPLVPDQENKNKKNEEKSVNPVKITMGSGLNYIEQESLGGKYLTHDLSIKIADISEEIIQQWICPYISRHLLSLNPLLACCRRYSRGER